MMSTILPLSNGTHCHAIEAGQGDTVVLIHGVGMQAQAWEPQIVALSHTYRVVAVDMPGHGKTPGLEGKPHLQDYVAWAARVLRALDIGTVAVAGHSMGALITAGLAVEHTELVQSAALLNAVHRRTPAAREAVCKRADEIVAGAGDITGPLARWFDEGDVGPRERVAGWLREVSIDGYAAAYRAFAEGDAVFADRLDQIACPLLVLTGAEDPNSTASMAKTMAQMAPLGEAVIIESHRHMVNLTAPDQVNDALKRFFLQSNTGVQRAPKGSLN